ncbi:MAG: ABC transporter permease, partial [Deinococcota bacterium]|nr:ABC transporter permease [Deinococcota bacterium]
GAYEGPLPDMVGLRLLAGRWPEGDAREAVVGEALAQTLYGEPLPLGESLNLFGRAYLVVGVFLGGEEANLGNVSSDQALVSLTTLPRPQARARAEILLEVAPGRDVDEALEAASVFLTERHDAPGLAPVHPHRPSELAPAVRGALTELSAVYRVLALALLLLGGAGLAAQMLVSLSLRVKEIGIRRATGASQGDVFRQFLGEGLELALLAGLAGVLLGVGASYLAARLQEVSFALDLAWLLGAIVVALLVAGLFSALPARLASSIPPARAMRENA